MVFFGSRVEEHLTLCPTLPVGQVCDQSAFSRRSDDHVVGKPKVEHILSLLDVIHTDVEVHGVFAIDWFAIDIIGDLSYFVGLDNGVLERRKVIMGAKDYRM